MLLNSPKPKPNILELSLQLCDRCHIWNVNFGYCCYHSKNSLAMSEPSLTPMSNNQDFSVICSVLNLTAMSLERFYAVVYPLQSRWPLIIITLILTTMIPKITMTTNITMITKHSWKNAQTAQTHVCHFCSLAVLFFASEHTSNVFLYFALKFVI